MSKPAIDPQTRLLTPATVMYLRGLQHALDAARKRKGYSSNPTGEKRDIENAELALQTYYETMNALLEDARRVGAAVA